MKSLLFWLVRRDPLFVLTLLCFVPPAAAQDDVLTSRYGSYRQSVTTDTTNPTRAAVQSPNFGLIRSVPVDGQVYAQPLYLSGVTVPAAGGGGGSTVRNLVFVATEHNTVYAFDEATLDTVWTRSLMGPPGSVLANATSYRPVLPDEVGTSDITVEIGITATPVIDPATDTIYVEAKTQEVVNGLTHYVHRLHALDAATGNAKFGGPILIADTILAGAFSYVAGPSVAGTGAGNLNGVVTFNALRELCRTGLALHNGIVYIACASHGDVGDYHGWILGYDTATLQLKAVFNATPNGWGAGFWTSGVPPAFDAQGNMYIAAGNGTFDALDSNGFPINRNFGNAVLKLAPDATSTAANPNPNGWGLRVVDYFTPYDEANLNTFDLDMGSGGVTLFPDGAGPSGHPNILVTGGKSGEVFVIDRNDMGRHRAPTSANPSPGNDVVQDLPNALPGGGGMFSGPALFGNQLFLAGRSLGRYTITNGAINGYPDNFIVAAGRNFPSPSPIISSRGTADGIVWVLSRITNQLLAYSTDDLGAPLFAGTTPSRVVKFSVPTVANGRVFAASGDATTPNLFSSWGTRTVGQSQTITFNPLPASAIYGDAPITLTATATSGLAVTFSIVSGPGQITNGNTLTITGAGSIIVQASQSGNTTWAAATSVTQTLPVAKANQTITFAALANRTTSDAALTLTATATSGLPVTLAVLSGPAAISGANALSATGIGAVIIRASQAGDTNYNAAPAVDRPFQYTLGTGAVLTATAGTPQTTALGATYPIALTARVTDKGAALTGVPVLFTAPAGSVTGTFTGGVSSVTVTSGVNGVAAAPAYTANNNAGTASVLATLSNNASAAFVLTQSATAPTTPNYSGYFDNAACDALTGWAADRNRPNQAISVDIVEGSTVLATIVANTSRGDVGALLGDNGLHGFSFTVPDSLKTGTVRTLDIRFAGTTQSLGGSPRTIQCTSVNPPPPTTPNYTGYFDSASCSAAQGWAADLNHLNQAISVDLLDGTTVVASAVLANTSRPDVGSAIGDNGLHGFSIPIPDALKNGVARNLTVRFNGTTTALTGSPRVIQCGSVTPPPATPRFTGYVDAAGCSAVAGWAADLNRLNQSISVDLLEGTNLIATVVANTVRTDVGAYIGDNGLHGFSIPIPDALKNGAPRSLAVRFNGSTEFLNNSPQTIQCGSTPPPTVTARNVGYLEFAGCSAVTGWAADLNKLNQPISVDLLDGTTLLATVLANSFRSDVGAYLQDNGQHAFSIPVPDSVKDGTTRYLGVRFTGSTEQLGNSPVPVTCTRSGTAPLVPIAPEGFLDFAGCDVISGWAADKSRPNTPFSVEILDGDLIVSTVLADISRPDVGAYLSDNGLHGFNLPTPPSLKDGRGHLIQARFAGTQTYLGNGLRPLQCAR